MKKQTMKEVGAILLVGIVSIWGAWCSATDMGLGAPCEVIELRPAEEKVFYNEDSPLVRLTFKDGVLETRDTLLIQHYQARGGKNCTSRSFFRDEASLETLLAEEKWEEFLDR